MASRLPRSAKRIRAGVRLALALSTGASLLAGCSGEPSRPTVEQVIASLGWEGAHVVSDSPMGPDRGVVVEGKRGVMPAVALLVVDADDRVLLTGTEDVSAVEPATMDAVGFNDVLYIYGRIRDPAIRQIALDLARGEIESFEIAPPAYAVRVEGVDVGAPQWWAFMNAGGTTVYAPAGPSPSG